jgi:hypothetical protein
MSVRVADSVGIAVTALKILAGAAVLIAAPLFWHDLIGTSLRPITGAAAPIFIRAEYLFAYALTLLSVAIVPFLRTTPLRVSLTVMMLASIAFDQAILALSGAHVDQELVNLLWQLRDNTRDGLSFFPQVAWHVVWLLPIAAIFILKPRPHSLPAAFALIPIAALAVTSDNVRSDRYQRVTQPPVFAIEAQLVKAMVMADPKTDPPDHIAYAGTITPRIKNIVFIVDESVGGRFISLNNRRFDDTPFLVSLVGKANFFNFGVASSIANCSTASRLLLRVGLRQSMLPDQDRLSLKAPNFWLYARRAGYRTIYFDAFRTALTFHSFMGTKEAGQIDERVPMAKAGDIRYTDHKIAHRLLKLLDDPEPQFIFIEKRGVHYPHTGEILPPKFNYRPKGVDTYAAALNLTPNEKAQVANYLKEINWEVDDFFKIVAPALDRPDTVIVYTSDHGQNMFQSPSKLFHCNINYPAIAEGEVPLFVATGNRQIASDLAETVEQHVGHSSHFEIFPTLLDWMGYDRRFIVSRYGPELYGPAPEGPRKFLARDPFDGKWFSADIGVQQADFGDLLGDAWFSWPDEQRNVKKSAGETRLEPFCSFDVSLGPKQNLGLHLLSRIAKGTTVSAGLWLWADSPVTLNLSVARDGGTKFEGSAETVRLVSTPTFYQASHTFEMDQPAWRLQLTNRGKSTIKFHACQVRVTPGVAGGLIAARIDEGHIKNADVTRW